MRPLWILGLVLLAAGPARSQEAKVSLVLNAGGHTSLIMKVFFTPDSKEVVTLSNDQTVRVCDVLTGETRKVFYPPGTIYPLSSALSPDGRRLALGSFTLKEGRRVHVVQLISLAEGKLERVLRGGFSGHPCVAFSWDGKRLAAGSSARKICIWDLAAGDAEPEKIFSTPEMPFGLAFSPDGATLALSGPFSGTLDAATGKVLHKFFQGGHDTEAHTVSWSADGKNILFAGRGVQVWAPDGKRRTTLEGKLFHHAAAFAPDSRRVLGVGYEPAKAFLYDLDSGKREKTFSGGERFHHGAISPNGKLVATVGRNAGRHDLMIWRTSDGKLLRHMYAHGWLSFPSLVAWHADGKGFAWKQGGPTFRPDQLRFGPPPAKGELRGRVHQQGPLTLQRESPNSMRVVKDGKPFQVLSRGKGGNNVPYATFFGKDRVALAGFPLALFDAATGKHVRDLHGHSTWVDSLAPSPDGRYLASVSWDQKLCVYGLTSTAPLFSMFASGKDWIAWTEEGYYAGTPGGERLMGWKVDNGPDQLMTFQPADRFRKRLYRPDVLKLLLAKGDVPAALETANAALEKQGKTFVRGVAELDQLLPPRVVLQVLEPREFPRVKVKAVATGSSKGQPVTALRLLLDGRPLAGGEGLADFGQGKPSAEVEWTFTLPEGKHQLAVLARAPEASAVSQNVELNYQVPEKQPLLHVVAVGVDAYEDASLRLQFAAADARALAEAFRKYNITGGLFRDVSATVLVNEQARREAVLKELAEVRKRVGGNDLLVVFFAGHGVKDRDGFYLLTVEAKTTQLAATTLSGEDLRKALAEFPCQVLLMLDACHSSAGIKNFRPAVDDITRNLTDDEVGVAVFCAAMSHEKALERNGNGLFTHAVVQALSRAEGVPYNRRNRRLYVHHLYSYVFDEVTRLSEDRQHPFLNLPWVVESFPVTQFPASGR